jgi:predicted transcriptional regulator of viral defense system
MSENPSPISIIQRLHELDLFFVTTRTLADLFELPAVRVYRLVTQLREMGLLAEVENGKYLVLGFEPERVLANPLFIASQLATPGYVSFWSALHYYGFTEQAPLTVFVATTVKKRPVVYRDQRFRFVTLQPRKLFGYRRETVGGLPVLLADEAKAIVDSLAESRYSGGVAEVARALHAALPQAGVATLVEYANRMGDKSLGSRLGFLLARLGHPQAGDDLIHAASPVKLDPSRPAGGSVDSPWQVNVNLPEADLTPTGVG